MTRNSTTLAQSSGMPSRPRGISCSSRSRISGLLRPWATAREESTKPGAMQLTWNVVRAQFGGEDAGVLDHAGFGDLVGHAAAVASAPEAGLGCDVDDLAAARGLHIGRGGLAAEDRAGQVDVEDIAVVIGRCGGRAMVGRGVEHAAGVVDEDIDPPERVYSLAQHGLDRGFVGHIGLDAQRAAAERLHFVGDGCGVERFIILLGCVEVHVVDDHIGAHFRQMQHIGPAQAARAAGDERDFVGEFHETSSVLRVAYAVIMVAQEGKEGKRDVGTGRIFAV